jgi:multiple sugar transport system permease protein
MLNSAIVAIPATAVPLILGSAAAYAFARFRFPLKDLIFMIVVVLMALPAQMIAIPVFQVMNQTGLLDTYLSVILVHTAWGMPWIMFFMRNFFDQLPRNVEESAMLQGASHRIILTHIVVPMSVAAFISAAVLQFIWVWSDFFFPLILLFSSEKMVAVQRLPLLKGVHLVDWGLLSAGTIIVVAVPIVIFAFLQRYYVRGMVGWSLK